MPPRNIRIRYIDSGSNPPNQTIKNEFDSKIIPRVGERVGWRNRRSQDIWRVVDVNYIYQVGTILIEITVVRDEPNVFSS